MSIEMTDVNVEPAGKVVSSPAFWVDPHGTPTWKGPSMERLIEEGLGKGVNVREPHRLFHGQITPTINNLDISKSGAGPFEFDEEVETMSSRKNRLSSSGSLPVFQPVSFKFGFDIQTEESSTAKMIARGQGIRKEKVSFKETTQIDNSDIDFLHKLRNEAERNGFQYCPGGDIPDQERDKMCKDVVGIANRGVTHYVSSVDLGAVEYTVTTENERKRKNGKRGQVIDGCSVVEENISASASMQKMEVPRNLNGQTNLAIEDDGDVTDGRIHLATSQGNMIACDVSPVWLLVDDAFWQKSVRKACQEYIDELTPISVDQGNTFLIEIADGNESQHLRVGENFEDDLDSPDGGPGIVSGVKNWLFGPSWDGPSMNRLQEEGLGKGIDATKPHQPLHTQITPTPSNLERDKVGTGYKEFNEKLETMYSVKNSLSGTCTVGLEAVQSVSFKVGFEIQREKTVNSTMTAHGKRIHKETVLFKPQSICGSSIPLVELMKEAAKKKGFNYFPGDKIPDEERDMICQDVIRNKNCGVTHYISSVDLGATVYEIKTEHEERRKGKTDAALSADGGAYGVNVNCSVDFSKECMERSKISEKGVYFVIHENVELKSERTLISPDQEKTISYSVKPIWDLVEDPAWRRSVQMVCKQYLDEHTPISVGSGKQLRIKIGSAEHDHYLKVGDGKVELTPDKEESCPFTLEFSPPKTKETVSEGSHEKKLVDPNCGFYLGYLTRGNQKLFIAAGKGHNVVLQPSPPPEQATFFLAHPVNKNPEPMSSWQDRNPLLLSRRYDKKRFLGPRVKTVCFLALDASDDGPLVLKEKKSTDDPGSYCQFSLERMIQYGHEVLGPHPTTSIEEQATFYLEHQPTENPKQFMGGKMGKDLLLIRSQRREDVLERV